jgi:hypothetical protein
VLRRRVLHDRYQEGVERLYPPRVYLVRPPIVDILKQTPGPADYDVRF